MVITSQMCYLNYEIKTLFPCSKLFTENLFLYSQKQSFVSSNKIGLLINDPLLGNASCGNFPYSFPGRGGKG